MAAQANSGSSLTVAQVAVANAAARHAMRGGGARDMVKEPNLRRLKQFEADMTKHDARSMSAAVAEQPALDAQTRRALSVNRRARNRMRRADLHWYALRIVSGREMSAQAALEGFRLAAWIPFDFSLPSMARRSSLRRVAPGLAFMGATPGQAPWARIFEAFPAVRGVLGVEGRPVIISGSRLNAFCQAVERELGSVRRAVRRRSLRPGDQARVTDGPLTGRIVEIADVNSDMAMILLGLFGADRGVSAPIELLEPISESGKIGADG